MTTEFDQGNSVWLGEFVFHLAREAPELLPSLRWLAGGGEVTEILFPGLSKAPSVEGTEQLLEFARRIGREEVLSLAEDLVANYEHDVRRVEAMLDAMEDREPDSWVHPVHVAPRPWPFDRLIKVCKLRRDVADPARRQRLESILEKLERAQAIEQGARERRAKVREK
jgi:hypothetical protein